MVGHHGDMAFPQVGDAGLGVHAAATRGRGFKVPARCCGPVPDAALPPIDPRDAAASGAVAPARPADEARRLAALRSYRIVDSPPEPAFDDAAVIAAQVTGTPMAFVNLVDDSRVWSKATYGVSPADTARDASFCAHAILEQGVLEVGDTHADARFRTNPYVRGDPRIRFYAGAPLRDESGLALGTVCVIDQDTRQLDPGQRRALEALARMVVSQLRLRISHLTLQETLLGLDPSLGAGGALQRDVTNRISHVLSTPLTPMMLQLHALRRHVTDPQGLKAIEVLDRNLARLGTAVRDVLAFTEGQGAPKAEFGKPH